MATFITFFALALIFVLLFVALLWKKMFVKVTLADGSKKRVFTRESVTFSVIVSRLIWALIGTVMFVYVVSLILPLFWMLYTSLKGDMEWYESAFAFPRELHFENYVKIFSMIKVEKGTKTYVFGEMLGNSVLFSVFEPLNSIFWITVVAYVMASFRFPGNKALYTLGIIIMVVPITGSIVSKMMIYTRWGIYDKLYLTMWFPPSTPFSGMNFLMIYAAIKAIPSTYREAASIDGANNYTIMFRIVLPMVIPTCVTFYLLGFIATWNSYENYLVWYPSTPNLAYGMYVFQNEATQGSGSATAPQILAGLFISMIPSMLLYLSFQKIITSKLTVGGLKG